MYTPTLKLINFDRFFVSTCRSLRQRRHVNGWRMRHLERRVRRRRPLQVQLVRRAALRAWLSAVGLHRTRLALVEARRHVADLMRQHVLLHVALVTTDMSYLIKLIQKTYCTREIYNRWAFITN